MGPLHFNDPAKADAFLRSSLAGIDDEIARLEALPRPTPRDERRIKFQIEIQKEQRDHARP